MTPRPTSKNGKPCWTIDARADGYGRIFAPSRQEVLEKYRRLIAGIDRVEFTDRDRLAKQEAGKAHVELLDALRYYLARIPATRERHLHEAATAYVAELKTAGVTKGYVASAAITLKHLQTVAGPDVAVSDLTPAHIKGFLASKAWSPGYRNTMRSRLSSFFHWAVTDGCCVAHPIKDRQVRSVKEPRRTPKIFTVEQCGKLLTTAQAHMPHMLPFLVLGLFCGIRPDRSGEMGKILSEHINLAEGTVDVPASKGDRRTIELPANARLWLRLSPKLEVVTDRYWRRQLCAQAGVKWSADVMRHTFASYHIKQHQNPGATALAMGHERSLKMLYKHYVAPVSREAAALFWQLEPAINLSVVHSVA